jgi:hypothetical protein
MKYSLSLSLVSVLLLVALTQHQVSAWIGPSMHRRTFLQDTVFALAVAPQMVIAADNPVAAADAAANLKKARDEQKKKEAEERKLAEDTKKRLAVGRIGLY